MLLSCEHVLYRLYTCDSRFHKVHTVISLCPVTNANGWPATEKFTLFFGYFRLITFLNWTGLVRMSEADFSKLSLYLQNIRVPASGSKIYKDECVYSFDTPVSTD